MAFPPILALALAGGAAYLLLSPQKKPQGAGSTPGTGLPEQPGSTTITVPPQVITNHPDVTPTNMPSVTVTVPNYTTGDKSDQVPPVQTATPPGTATGTPTGSVARFPDLPGGPVTLPPITIPTYPIPGATADNPIPIPPAATPVQTEETKVDQDPFGTVALAKALIDVESQSGWKTALQPLVAAWQSKVGLKADGKFGPGSAAKMALEVGILPLIRFYPKSTQLATDLKAYRDVLYTMAANAENNNPAHAAGLRSSAVYETGQAYSGTPKAIPVAARIAQANLLKSQMGA